ncbi:RECEPTOR-LIKE PROTEIN 12 ISOFORM X1 [Salix koriyanagi]|uniref:RECEPTOR-LIKE PROTEIN 12 ISOFORM X1 n=1 Tax=Salix koriyanagi TaxID=2511006 RepID=A0A9Q1ABD3_9ROSI|nr:RECEPTOR-LIKE PROTEIN 12 ISOFORM X1 [Salix koriyanagi]
MHKNYAALIVLVLLLHINPLPEFTTGVTGAKFRCIERERQALLQFKEDLTDDYGVLSSWGREEEKRDCCKWRGVGCDNITGHVTLLDLHSSPVYEHLVGKVSDSLLELQYLNYLDLSLNNFDDSMMSFIGSLTSLRYLNLSRLQSLDLSYSFDASVENLDWLSHLSSLESLDLSGSNLSKVNDWLKVIRNLPRLKELGLNQCSLPDKIPPPLSFVNSSKFLAVLHLSNNNLSSSIYPWLYNSSNSLVDLDLSGNQLKGSIPDAFRNMSALTKLVLSGNQLEGGIPRSLGEMCSLHVLDLCHNHISEELSGLLQNLYGRTESSLEVLRLCHNQLTGSLPDIARFSSLRELDISYNRLSGCIPESIGFLSKLEHVDVSFNSFQGVVSGEHFSNLSKLQNLDLSYNSLVLRFKSDWDPTFQLNTIRLSSCNLGPCFPKWLRTQRNVHILDISRANISDKIPNWFWNLLPTLSFLNLSHNSMTGTLPDLSSANAVDGTFPVFDLSFNQFEGLLPAFPSMTSSLILSNNLFSGPISHKCNIAGKIPSSVGSLFFLQTLSLHNNTLHGELPMSLKNCSMLKFLDLGENRLSGEIPPWIGESLSSLMFLSLQSNEFIGSIPPHICQLRNVRILDLSLNNITGAIPECLNNLTAMVRRGESETVIGNHYLIKKLGAVLSGGYYINKARVGLKGRDYEYERNLGLLRVIDFSGNNLSGEIPEEITGLLELVALNLSGNNLTGVIPQRIGQLDLLESLDLSRNQFHGAIPPTMARLNFLSYLDVSYNNLSGKIPSSTQIQSFNASAFTGNPALCGLPVTRNCPGDVVPLQSPVMNDVFKDKNEFSVWFYIGMEYGFFVFFCGFPCALMLKHSWRHCYFQFLDELLDFLCLILRAHKSKQKSYI